MDRCRCNPEEIIAGHRPDCPLNEELAQVNKPLPPPRKPFEEMTRDEMILAHTALRHSIATYVAGLHEVGVAAFRLIAAVEHGTLTTEGVHAVEGMRKVLGVYKAQPSEDPPPNPELRCHDCGATFRRPDNCPNCGDLGRVCI